LRVLSGRLAIRVLGVGGVVVRIRSEARVMLRGELRLCLLLPVVQLLMVLLRAIVLPRRLLVLVILLLVRVKMLRL
jgi:hypothetical protein